MSVREAGPTSATVTESRVASRQASPHTTASPVSTLIRLAPIAFFLTYLVSTILVFFFGPWRWPIADATKLNTFLVLAHAALLAGYLSAAFGGARPYAGRWSPTTLTWVGIATVLVLFGPTLIWLTEGNIDLSAILEPGSAYRRLQDLATQERPTHPVSYLRVLLAAPLAMAGPLTFFYWERLGRWARILGVCAIVADVLVFTLTGRNKGLGNFVLLMSIGLALRMGAGKIRLSLRRVLGAAAAVAVVMAIFVAAFTRNGVDRARGRDISDAVPILNGMYSDEDNALVRYAPEQTRFAVRMLTFDETHGYFALYMALDMPFESAFPVGHSFALQTQVRRIFGSTWLADRSYTNRLEPIWPNGVFWHTTYVWFASDVSFAGVIVLLFVFGRVLAQSWLDSISGHNPFAVACFTSFALMVYYLPTNNVMLGFPESYSAFVMLVIGWRMTRGKALTPPAT